MKKWTGVSYSRFTDSGMTLIELLASVSITLVLTVLLLPSIQAAIVRANVSKVMIDMRTIAKALELYGADHGDYPPTHWALSPSAQIHEIPQFDDPNPYLSPVPHFPWEGQMSVSFVQDTPGEYVYCPQANYFVTRRTSFRLSETRHIEQLGWYLDVGGPISCCPSFNPITWYAPTNGTLSRGGFIMNSMGRSNCH